MRKGRGGEWNGMKKIRRKKNNGEYSGPLSSLPVDRLTATDCNANRSCQKGLNELEAQVCAKFSLSVAGGEWKK